MQSAEPAAFQGARSPEIRWILRILSLLATSDPWLAAMAAMITATISCPESASADAATGFATVASPLGVVPITPVDCAGIFGFALLSG